MTKIFETEEITVVVRLVSYSQGSDDKNFYWDFTNSAYSRTLRSRTSFVIIRIIAAVMRCNEDF